MSTIERRLRKLESIQVPLAWKMVPLIGDERKGETADGVVAQWRSENPGETEDIFFIVRMIVDHTPSMKPTRHDLH